MTAKGFFARLKDLHALLPEDMLQPRESGIGSLEKSNAEFHAETLWKNPMPSSCQHGYRKDRDIA